MKKTVIAIVLFLGFASFTYGQTGFNGTWVTTDFGAPSSPNYLVFNVAGAKLTGTISRTSGVFDISDGTANGDTTTFKAAVIGRTISYTGKLSGDTITFTRSASVRDATSGDGAGIVGTKGPMQFTAKRDAAASTSMVAFYGNWKMNVLKSKYQPGPAPKPIVPDVVRVRPSGNGAVEVFIVSAGELGNPSFSESTFKIDGKDYPINTLATLTTLLAGAKPTTNTNSAKSIDPRAVEITFKTNNAVTSVLSQTVTPDNKTMTVTRTNQDAQGKQTAKDVIVYNRMP